MIVLEVSLWETLNWLPGFWAEFEETLGRSTLWLHGQKCELEFLSGSVWVQGSDDLRHQTDLGPLRQTEGRDCEQRLKELIQGSLGPQRYFIPYLPSTQLQPTSQSLLCLLNFAIQRPISSLLLWELLVIRLIAKFPLHYLLAIVIVYCPLEVPVDRILPHWGNTLLEKSLVVTKWERAHLVVEKLPLRFFTGRGNDIFPLDFRRERAIP